MLVSALLLSGLGDCSRCHYLFKNNAAPATNLFPSGSVAGFYVNARSKVQRANLTHPLQARCVTPSLPLLKAAPRNTDVWSEGAFQVHCHGKALVGEYLMSECWDFPIKVKRWATGYWYGVSIGSVYFL